MAAKNEQKNQEEYMLDFLDDFTSKENTSVTPQPKLPSRKSEVESTQSLFVPKNEERREIPKLNVVKNHTFDKSRYEEVVLTELPLSRFYKKGTRIFFRECSVKEIQRYSTLDERSVFDFKDKLNDIIEECTFFENPDGSLGSYEQILEGDRTWMIYLIREKTFPKGKVLSVKVNYKDKEETKSVNIELKRSNIEVWKDEDIMEYYDKKTNSFIFETTLRDDAFVMKPPTIGLKKCFDHYLKIKKENEEEINSTFFKIAPFLKPNVNYMTWEEFEDYETWFMDKLSPDEYSFLFDIIDNHLKIGIRGLKKNMGTSVIRSRKMYPNKLTTLFLLPNAFRLFLK